ncbi:MAG: hypothetical protein HOP23_14620 [Methylococcaceae bacterium]|nr:hypothetical protein [Methylococcaceae bacterium]
MNDNNLPATLSDRMAALRQKATQAPEAWNPEPGDALIGILIGHQKAVGSYGENFQILVKDEVGTVTAAWLTQWLKQNLQSQGAETGELIALTFLGKKQSPAGRFYNAYSLIVDKA